MSPTSNNSYFFPEEDFTSSYSFTNPLESDERSDVFSSKPVFAFNNICLTPGVTYSFDRDELSSIDSRTLLRRLKEISDLTINELIDESDHELHFHILTQPNSRIMDLLKELTGKERFLAEEIPIVAQFGLYTHKLGANRQLNRKSPRIICIIGKYAVIHLLYFDPYHELHPRA